MENEVLKRASAYFARANVLPNGVPAVRELAGDGFPVTVACRVLKVSTSGYSDWLDRPPSTVPSRVDLAAAIFEGTEDWYNPQRRHTSLEDRSPAEFENLHTAANEAA